MALKHWNLRRTAVKQSLKGAVAVAACSSRIPPATQGPEGGDGGASNFGLRLRLLVAHLQQVAVGIQYLDQADHAAFVGGKRVLARTRERRFISAGVPVSARSGATGTGAGALSSPRWVPGCTPRSTSSAFIAAASAASRTGTCAST